jgi:hypothetical protein
VLGLGHHHMQSPIGRHTFCVVPEGTRKIFITAIPALACWATFVPSFGLMSEDFSLQNPTPYPYKQKDRPSVT